MSYLSDKVQFVNCGSTCSSSVFVTSGVVAGIVLGPTLFALVINSLAYKLDDDTPMVICLQMTSKY